MSIITTGTLPEALYPGIAETWGTSYKQYPALYPEFFKVESSDQNFEKEQQFTGTPIASVKEEGNQVTFERIYQGYQKEYRHYTYSIGASVTQEMVEDDQYNIINQIPKFLSRSLREVEEVVAHLQLNNGFTTNTGPDGQALFSTAHPLVGTGGTLSNTPTTPADLTETALENAIISLMDWTDDQGLKAMTKPKTLVVPTAYAMTARKILETQYKVGTADNDKNIVNTYNLKLVVSPYITDSDAWFLFTDAEMGLKFKVRRPATLQKFNDDRTQNMNVITTKRFSTGFTDWRAAYASPGA